jgi:hypothetical protein
MSGRSTFSGLWSVMYPASLKARWMSSEAADDEYDDQTREGEKVGE